MIIIKIYLWNYKINIDNNENNHHNKNNNNIIIIIIISDEGLTLTKDEGTCLRRLSMFKKKVH